MGDRGKQRDAVRAEAADWFARLRSVPVSRETLDQFFIWRKVEAHGVAFDEVEQFWVNAGAVADRPAVVAAAQAALTREPEAPRGPFDPGKKGLFAVAAAVAVGGAAVLLSFAGGGTAYVTKVGEQSVVTLADGSKLTLDTDTRLTVALDKTARHVRLDHGEAYFTVAHDAARPFTVESAGIAVTATGTQFDVRHVANGTDVTLVEGSVRVDRPGGTGPARLVAGQQYRAQAGQPIVVRAVDTRQATAWKRGQIVLDGVTLTEAIAEVNRYTTMPVRLDAPALGDRRFGGVFETGDVASFVTAATALLPLKAEHAADGSIRLVATGSRANS